MEQYELMWIGWTANLLPGLTPYGFSRCYEIRLGTVIYFFDTFQGKIITKFCLACNVMKLYDQSHDGSNLIGIISYHNIPRLT